MSTRTHRIVVRNQRCNVTTEQLTASLWIASGDYGGVPHKAEGETEKVAMRRWREWAERKSSSQ